MKGLTKENTWDAVKAKSPVAFEDFMKWLDKWKEDNLPLGGRIYQVVSMEVETERLGNINVAGRVTQEYEPFPFHNWPLEMQMGVLAAYAEQHLGSKDEDTMEEVASAMFEQMSETFEEIEEILVKS